MSLLSNFVLGIWMMKVQCIRRLKQPSDRKKDIHNQGWFAINSATIIRYFVYIFQSDRLQKLDELFRRLQRRVFVIS